MAESNDISAFLRALALSRERGASISADHIALVETAWTIPDTVVSSYGWVLVLKSGCRLYLKYTLDDTGGAAATEELELVDLRPDEVYPTLDDDTGVSWYRPDDLNRQLGLIPPTLN
jgi:hypothetical protein